MCEYKGFQIDVFWNGESYQYYFELTRGDYHQVSREEYQSKKYALQQAKNEVDKLSKA